MKIKTVKMDRRSSRTYKGARAKWKNPTKPLVHPTRQASVRVQDGAISMDGTRYGRRG